MTWSVTNTSVASELEISYSFLPLTFHHAVWVPHKLVPYLLDNCHWGPNECIIYEYIEFCFENLDSFINSYGISQDDLQYSWASKVANHFGLPVLDILHVYDPNKDTHNSEMRTRYMFKWNTHHH